jgi:hypothetical protein
MVLRDQGDGIYSALYNGDIVDVFSRLLADTDRILVGHNVAYDLAVMADYAAHRGASLLPSIFAALQAGRIRDTMIREILLAIAQDRLDYDPITRKAKSGLFSLGNLVKRYFDVDIAKGADTWRLRYGELDGIPCAEWPHEAQTYALDDPAWTLRVFEAQSAPYDSDLGRPVVDAKGNITDEIPQTAAAFALHLMACWGVRTDPTAVQTFVSAQTRIAMDGEAAAERAGFLRPPDKKGKRSRNMATLRALVSAAYTGLDVPLTPGGQFATDQDTLLASGHPDLIAYAESSSARDAMAKLVPILERAVNVPLTSSPNVLVSTGRTSWRDPNMQNPPRKGGFRECFVPREGNVFVSVDYDTAELRAQAQILLWWFGESALARTLQAGIDPHTDMSADYLGISYKEAVKRLKKADPETVKARDMCKAANFGLWGGMGITVFRQTARAYDLDLDEPTAKRLKAAFFAKWDPDARLYFDRIGRASQFGSFTQVQAVSLRQRAGCSYTSGANTMFQGLVADFAKAALWDLSRECYTGKGVLRYVRPVLFLHDEIIAEGPEETLTEWADEMTRVVIAAGKRYLPDIPVTASPAAMRHWYKRAKEVRDEKGRLIPWMP